MAFLEKKTKTSIRNWNTGNTKVRRKAFLAISVLNLSLMETKEDTDPLQPPLPNPELLISLEGKAGPYR